MTDADWVEAASSDQARRCFASLARLPMAEYRRLPPPLEGGRPFGLEHTVLRRYLSGQSCNVYPSALSAWYQRSAPATVQTLFQAFVAGIPVAGDALARALGAPNLEEWLAAGLLEAAGGRYVRAPFRFICTGNAVLLVDPLTARFHNRIHLGQDSLALCGFLARLGAPRGRILDVGTGSGVVLINEARSGAVDEAIGVDINPRAVRIADLNARMNGVTARFSEQNIFATGTDIGLFDRVTWNAPFRFMPDSERNDNIDGFGGRLGIGLTLDFVGVLPRLLRQRGEAIVMSAGPRLRDGRRPLDDELATAAGRAGLDVELHVRGMFFDARWREFHRRHGVEGFESVILRLRAGSGLFRRIGPGPAVRVVDGIRRLVHSARQVAGRA